MGKEYIPAAAGGQDSTHDLDFRRRLCRRFILLEDGKVALDGDEIRAIKSLWNEDLRRSK